MSVWWVLACTAAYALSRFRFPGRRTALTTFLVVQMFPASLLILTLYVLLHRMGLLNSLTGLELSAVGVRRGHGLRARGAANG